MRHNEWPVSIPSGDRDPFEQATLWALDRPYAVVVIGPELASRSLRGPKGSGWSVHARTLLESLPPLNVDGPYPTQPHPTPNAQPTQPDRTRQAPRLVRMPGVGIILAQPSAHQLARLDRRRVHPTATWFLIFSAPDSEDRQHQDAWLEHVTHPHKDLSTTAPPP